MFNLHVDEEASIGDLAAKVRAGESVVRSSHAGNQYASNLALLRAGIPAVQYDRTTGEKDRNYHPHLILRDGQSRLRGVLCHPSTLVARTTAGTDHLRVLRRVIPEEHARIELYGDYLRRHEACDRSVLSILRQVGHTLGGKTWQWHRFVEDSGTIVERRPATWAQIEAEGIFGVTRETHGWIMPNIFNVLLMSLFESLEYRAQRIHHLSGPDMIQYIGRMAPEISALWDEVASYIGAPLDLEFHLYPTAAAKFATIASRRGQLDELIYAYEAFDEFRRGKGEQIKSAPAEERRELIGRLTASESNLRNRVDDAVRKCPELFVDITTGQHFTHHDADRYGLYVPRWTLEQPLSRLAKVHKDLAKTHTRVMKQAAA